MREWPDFADELSRKALDVFERALHRHLAGELSPLELRIIVDTLTDTISGLVPKDVLDVIYGARKELRL